MNDKLKPRYSADAGGANVYDADGSLVCTTVVRRLHGSIVAKLLNEYARLEKLRERLVDKVIVEERIVDEKEPIPMMGFREKTP